MKTTARTILALLLCLLGAGPVLAQSFEGTIKQRTLTLEEDVLYDLLMSDQEDEPEYDSEEAYNRAMAERLFALSDQELEAAAMGSMGGSAEMTISVKGDRMRMESSDGDGYSIMDGSVGTVWMVSPAERRYVEYTRQDQDEAQSKAEEMAARMGIDPSAMAEDEEWEDTAGPARVEPLSQTREISGYAATGFMVSNSEEVSEVWCAEVDRTLRAALKRLEESARQWSEDGEEDSGALEDEACPDGFPVLTRSYRPYVGMFEVTQVLGLERTSLDDALFQVPEGYQKVDLSALWR